MLVKQRVLLRREEGELLYRSEDRTTVLHLDADVQIEMEMPAEVTVTIEPGYRFDDE